MAERPLILLHASFDDDPEKGISNRMLKAVQEDFDVLWLKDLQKNPELGKNVIAAQWRPGTKPQITENLHNLPFLKIIGNFGVGYDHIDVKFFNEHGVKVVNTPDVLCDSVADMVFALMLASARRLVPGMKDTMGPEPIKKFNQNLLGLDVCYATLGILGMGGVGFKVAIRAKAFSMKILYHNRNRRSESDENLVGATFCSDLTEMLPQCDFLVLTCPLTPQTTQIIGRDQFNLMKPTSTVINLARGKVIDTAALVEALEMKKIAAAALDVTEPEPLPRDHPLLKLENVIITPHAGTATVETRDKMNRLLLDNIKAHLEGKPLLSEVKPKN